MMQAEAQVYYTLSTICETYKGAYWHFYELSNGGFYMAPDLTEKLPIFVYSNGYEGLLSTDAAGIISTLYAINHFCCASQSEKLLDRYELLRDYAEEHSEALEIYGAID